MLDDILNNLPILKVFEGLKRWDVVYSKQYGIGRVWALYGDDEAIIQFSHLRKRLSVHEDISKVPEEYVQKKISTKVEVICNGKSISFAEFRKRNKAEKKRIKLEKQLQKEEQIRRRCSGPKMV